MAKESVQHTAEDDERERVADEDLGAEGPVEEGDVAGVPRPAVDAGADEGMLGRSCVDDEMREVGGGGGHG